MAGSIGVAPAANLNPEREFPSMFEPVHRSAPDIAGRGVANPLGAIWSASMMLEHLGHPAAAAEVFDAFTHVLATTPVRTRDLGGTASTDEFTRLVLENHRPIAERSRRTPCSRIGELHALRRPLPIAFPESTSSGR